MYAKLAGACVFLSAFSAFETAQAAASDPTTLKRIQVVEDEPTYAVPNSSTATKTELALRDIPQTVNVVTREELEDRGVSTITDALKTVPGVQAGTGYGGLGNGYGTYIRGFFSGTNYRDGFRDFSFVSSRDLALFEQIEVLKGPASVLYGSNEPGGILNFVTKRPRFDSQQEIALTLGSFDSYRIEADSTGAIAGSERFAYRIVAAYEEGNSHRDFVEHDRWVFAPSVSWQFTERSTATLMLEYLEHDYTFERGFSNAPEFLDLPRSRFLEEPSLNYATTDSRRAVLEITHAWNERWSLRAAASYIKPTIEKLNLFPLGLQDDRRTFERSVDFSKEHQEDRALQLELSGRFQTGVLEHSMLFGLEYYRDNFHYTFSPFDLIDTIDIYEPVYGDVQVSESFLQTVAFGHDYGTRTRGLYGQDVITFSAQWKALVGARYDRSELFSEDLVNPASSLREQTQDRTSPRLGLVYQPTDAASLYVSYATSFNPQIFYPLENGDLPKPEVGKQLEVGWKHDWLQGLLASTVSIFEIRKENVTTTDPQTRLGRQIGEQRSRGAELELRGQPLAGLNAIIGLTYLNAEVTKDLNLPVGDRLRATPELQASMWLKYQPNPQGMFGGAGIYHSGERETELPNNGFVLPGETRVDAMLGYQHASWRLQLNLRNLLNEDNYLQSGVFLPGPGRNGELTLRTFF